MGRIGTVVVIGLIGGLLSLPLGVTGHTRKAQLSSMVPKEYQAKRMPAGWWTDPKIIAEGKQLYEGTATETVHTGVVCAVCHGPDGKPLIRGVRDLNRASYIADMTESYWYWRVVEGVPRTAMQGWKDVLTETQIWKVIAYEHTFSHEGKPAAHDH